jgi:carboxypeptidase D
MIPQFISFILLAAGLFLPAASIPDRSFMKLHPRQVPADPIGVKTIVSPSNVTIRYKEPGKEGVCETTPGVNSYSGYIDIAPDAHAFFWFFEARHNPQDAPITLWRMFPVSIRVAKRHPA